jgi:hypothetical protein
MQKWQYETTILWADAKKQQELLETSRPNRNPAKFAPQALIPELDKYGQSGWELIHIEPVTVRYSYDVAKPVASSGEVPPYKGTHVYFCVFKRPVPDDTE